jgi:uncharacterized protein involved in exopolysaccharide biosynthesis
MTIYEGDSLVASGAELVEESTYGLLDILAVLAEGLKLLTIGPLLVGAIALAGTYLLTPKFTARTVFLPPQSAQGASASVLQSLGALANLTGMSSGAKSPGEQYVALMQSTTMTDRVVLANGLAKVYAATSAGEAREALSGQVRISMGKKDGMVTVDVDDADPKRAAEIANSYVDQLRRFANEFALTEAQQRRMFFEKQLNQTRDHLTLAQRALQKSGISEGVLRAEPRAAAEAYAALKSQVSAAEVQLQALRNQLTDQAPEYKRVLSLLVALRSKLTSAEAAGKPESGDDYIGVYREFKYQEALFDLLSKQFELAKLDESRDGALIQVVDPASPPEKKSKPRRGVIAAVAAAATFVLLLVFLFARESVRVAASDVDAAPKLARLRSALRY